MKILKEELVKEINTDQNKYKIFKLWDETKGFIFRLDENNKTDGFFFHLEGAELRVKILTHLKEGV